MKALIFIGAVLLCVVVAIVFFIIGAASAGAVKSDRLARQNGFSRGHRDIYRRSMDVLNKITNAYALDASMDPLLRRVQLPESLDNEARKVIEDYRKEIDA